MFLSSSPFWFPLLICSSSQSPFNRRRFPAIGRWLTSIQRPLKLVSYRHSHLMMLSRFTAMAGATWLSSPLLPQTLHRRCISPRRHRLISSLSSRRIPEAAPVIAQARRSSSSKLRDDEIATLVDLQFEAPLEIVEYPDPVLRAKNKRINAFDDNLKKLVAEMFDVMYRTDGIGLSAPQVGKNVQLMVFNPVGERGEGEEVVLVNPKISRYSRKLAPYEEGCLSFPGIRADVLRPDSVRIDAQDITGERFEVHLDELPARVFQHEFDHLLGILFFDRMTDEILDTIRADLQALEKKYEDRTGLPSPERIDALRRRKTAVGFGKS